jgi:hypothetical protein
MTRPRSRVGFNQAPRVAYRKSRSPSLRAPYLRPWGRGKRHALLAKHPTDGLAVTEHDQVRPGHVSTLLGRYVESASAVADPAALRASRQGSSFGTRRHGRDLTDTDHRVGSMPIFTVIVFYTTPWTWP